MKRHAVWTVWVLGAMLPSLAAQQPAPDPVATLRVTAQLVLVDAAVELKKTGRPFAGLTAADFVLSEDGVPQTITSISEDTLPLSLLFLFDLTDSVHPVLEHLADGADAVLHHLRPQDEVAVMSFSSHAKLEQRFTRDRMTAVEGMDGAAASYDRREPTFLFEDLWEAAQQSQASRVPDARRVQIWLTDGSANDQDAQRDLAHHAPAELHTREEATDALLRSGAVVSALIERSGATERTSGHFGDIERYAALTGGPVLYAGQGDVAARFATLLDTLRQRYTLGYRPGEAKAEGTLCHVKLGLSPAFFATHPEVRSKDVVLRSRQSYIRSASSR